MAQTFFFYDLETSGLNPRDDRIMQFAGQRTDLNPVSYTHLDVYKRQRQGSLVAASVKERFTQRCFEF